MMTKNQLDQISLNRGVVDPRLFPRVRFLHGGKFDLPIRALTGLVHDDILKINRLFSYKQHVAIFALTHAGMHRHLAAQKVACFVAGTFAGSLEQFERWPERRKLDRDVICTTLPDGCDYVIWSRKGRIHTKVIPMVFGWDGANLRDWDDCAAAGLLPEAFS